MLKRNRSRSGLTRRDFLRLSAGGMGAAALGGPLGAMSAFAAPRRQDITGRVEIWGYTGTIDHFIAAKDRLEEMYPGLEIVTQQFDYPTAHTNILNALTSGMGVPDLVNFDVNYVGDFAAGMLDITDRFAPYAAEFAPVAVQLASTGGKLCGLPQDNQPMGYAYRADIFEEYGITEDDLATWDGYIDAAKKLWTDSGETIKMISMDAPGSQMPVLGEPHQIHEVFFHLAGLPGVFFDKEDTHVVIDEPAAIAAIEKFQQICDPEVSYISQTKNASIAAYQSGLVASNICPAWWPLGLNNQLADQSGLWRIMRLPALEEGGLRAAFQIPTVTGIPTMAANPDAAWAILYEAQLTTEAQLRFNEVTGGIFVTNNDAVDILVERELPYFGGQKIYELFNEILADVPDVYFGRGWVEARSILTSGIEPIMRGEMTAEEGLTASAEEMRRRLNKE